MIVLMFVLLQKNFHKSQIFNIGSGISTSYISIAKTIVNTMGFGKLDFIEIPPKIKKQYQYYSRANVSLLRKAGYRKKIFKNK